MLFHSFFSARNDLGLCKYLILHNIFGCCFCMHWGFFARSFYNELPNCVILFITTIVTKSWCSVASNSSGFLGLNYTIKRSFHFCDTYLFIYLLLYVHIDTWILILFRVTICCYYYLHNAQIVSLWLMNEYFRLIPVFSSHVFTILWSLSYWPTFLENVKIIKYKDWRAIPD